MNTAHFQNLPETICRCLEQAQQSIQIAICWFSRKDIFDVLMARLRAGVQVSLLLEYDNRNICDGGLDFQKFIQAGGQLYAHREAGLMHHKFAVVDGRLLLTGSYNWTYNSNAENLLESEDLGLIVDFQEAFVRQKAVARRIFQVKKDDVRFFSAFPLFENTRFHLVDLRKKIGGGAAVWVIRIDKLKIDNHLLFRENQLPFDAQGLLRPCWTAYRRWDGELFEKEMEAFGNAGPVALHLLRCWTQRMKTGDIVLAVTKGTSSLSMSLAGVGVIQSGPQAFSGKEFSSYRDVQWLRVMEDRPQVLQEKLSIRLVGRFRGSALRFIQEIFEKKPSE